MRHENSTTGGAPMAEHPAAQASRTTTRKPIIILTGGGSGGHLFPLIAVAEELRSQMEGGVTLFYLGPRHPLNEEFRRRGISVRTLAAGKIRRYASFQNLVDIPKFFLGLVQALANLYAIMPDAVFSKGGSGAFPVVLAAWFYRVPVLIHESDSVPGLTNRLSAHFAKRIGIAFRSAAAYFPPAKTALVGNPVRKELLAVRGGDHTVAKHALGFDPGLPLLLVLGGSQGSTRINTFIVEHCEMLLQKIQIYHQTGTASLEEVRESIAPLLAPLEPAVQKRYRAAGSFRLEALVEAFGAADIVLSRAGAGAIYETAASGVPAILVPLPEAAQNHQRMNAVEYAATGAATVIEEENLTPHIVLSEMAKIEASHEAKTASFEAAARAFVKPDAAAVIAREILKFAGS